MILDNTSDRIIIEQWVQTQQTDKALAAVAPSTNSQSKTYVHVVQGGTIPAKDLSDIISLAKGLKCDFVRLEISDSPSVIIVTL